MIRLSSDHYTAFSAIDDLHIDCNRQVKVLLQDGRVIIAEQGYGQTAYARLAQLVDEINIANSESVKSEG